MLGANAFGWAYPAQSYPWPTFTYGEDPAFTYGGTAGFTYGGADGFTYNGGQR